MVSRLGQKISLSAYAGNALWLLWVFWEASEAYPEILVWILRVNRIALLIVAYFVTMGKRWNEGKSGLIALFCFLVGNICLTWEDQALWFMLGLAVFLGGYGVNIYILLRHSAIQSLKRDQSKDLPSAKVPVAILAAVLLVAAGFLMAFISPVLFADDTPIVTRISVFFYFGMVILMVTTAFRFAITFRKTSLWLMFFGTVGSLSENLFYGIFVFTEEDKDPPIFSKRLYPVIFLTCYMTGTALFQVGFVNQILSSAKDQDQMLEQLKDKDEE